MNYSFLSPLRIIVGDGEILNIYDQVPSNSKNIVLFHGSSFSKKPVFQEIKKLFSNNKSLIPYCVASGEPCPESVDKAATFAAQSHADAIIGIGGGSVMDTAKAVAALVTNGGKVIDYLEGVGTGKRVVQSPLPLILAPTTTGTGTEVTKNAVISSRSQGFKKSMRDDTMLADIAIIDPLLTEGLPRNVLASSGMDAICQLVESYTTKNANSITDALSLFHAKRAVDAIIPAYENDDKEARTTLGVAAMVSGLTLANAGLGVAHGIASGLGALFDIPHGIACGILLPVSMRFNIERGVEKYADLGELFIGKKFDTKKAACEAAIDYIEMLNEKLNIPKDLKDFKLTHADAIAVAETSTGSSMSKNPVPVSLDDSIAMMKSLI